MSMGKHRELVWLGAGCLLSGILAVFLAVFTPLPFWLLLCINDLALFLCFWRVLHVRHREIKRLSLYLQRIYEGEESFELQDYREGELSMLKSDLHKLTRLLFHQRELLEKDKVFLADSLSNISHQMKTPLTSMLTLSELLLKQELPQKQRKLFLTQLHRQLERMEWLVRTLLKLSKIDADAVCFEKTPCCLKRLLKESVEPLLIAMELKQVELQIDCDERLQLCIDENWTKEAIVNIVKNCLEHSEEGGRIVLSCEENPLYVGLRIKDEGSGIAKEDLPHIFERFYRGKNALGSSVGIGLSLSKTILQRQDAVIEAESEPGKGTCFLIRFYKGS